MRNGRKWPLFYGKILASYESEPGGFHLIENYMLMSKWGRQVALRFGMVNGLLGLVTSNPIRTNPAAIMVTLQYQFRSKNIKVYLSIIIFKNYFLFLCF